MVSYDPKSYDAHCFRCLDIINTVVLLIVALASHDDASDDSVKWLKCHSASHFDHLEPKNAVVMFLMPSVSFEMKTGILWPKMSCCTLFQSCWFNKQNSAIDNAISVMWCSHWCQQITWPKYLCQTLFQLSSPNDQNGTIDGAVIITWQQYWHQWYHMTKMSWIHLTLIIVT